MLVHAGRGVAEIMPLLGCLDVPFLASRIKMALATRREASISLEL